MGFCSADIVAEGSILQLASVCNTVIDLKSEQVLCQNLQKYRFPDMQYKRAKKLPIS